MNVGEKHIKSVKIKSLCKKAETFNFNQWYLTNFGWFVLLL